MSKVIHVYAVARAGCSTPRLRSKLLAQRSDDHDVVITEIHVETEIATQRKIDTKNGTYITGTNGRDTQKERQRERKQDRNRASNRDIEN